MDVDNLATQAAVEYNPLGLGEFRLLRIWSRRECSTSHESDEIQCDLFVIARAEAGPYECLSYTWGTDDPNHIITINGAKHKVRQNLLDALHHLRFDDQQRIIWIDALCNNQTDTLELNVQVPLMREIYGNATSTFVWLGMSDDSSNDVIAHCNRIGGELNNRNIFDNFSGLPERKTNVLDIMSEFSSLPSTEEFVYRNQYLERLIHKHLEELYEEAHTNMPQTLSFVLGMKALLSRAYWDRVWIRQEFIVSKEIKINCGGSQINLPELRAAMFFLSLMQRPVFEGAMAPFVQALISGSDEIKTQLADWINGGYDEQGNRSGYEDPELRRYKDIRNIAYAFHEVDWGNLSRSTMRLFGLRSTYGVFRDKIPGYEKDRFTLFEILAKANIEGTLQASNDKDRVYGLLGMASDRDDLAIPVNYAKTKTVNEVFEDTARALIQRGHLDILSLAQHSLEQLPATPNSPTNVPTWVPNWRNKILRPCGQLPWDTSFSMCGNQSLLDQRAIEACSAREIGLAGWIVDTITDLGTPWQPTNEDFYSNYTAINRFMNQILEFCNMSDAIFASNEAGVDDIYIASPEGTRASAPYLIPVADQEQYSTGFIRRARENTNVGYQEVVARVRDNALAPTGSGYVTMMSWQRFRRPFLSTRGYVGLAPDCAEIGDLIVVLAGAKLPYILRRCASSMDEQYTLVGEAYVHGIMYGEFADHTKESDKTVFCLI